MNYLIKLNLLFIQQEMNSTSNSTIEDASNADLLGSPIYPPDFQDVEVKVEPLEPDTVSSKHVPQNLTLHCSLVIIK